MLIGQKPIDFKKAVFLSENAYFNGQLNYKSFCDSISFIAQKLKALIQKRGFTKYKTAGNWAVFAYLMDSLPINSFRPYSYDFDDFMGEKDYSKMFVTKLMMTKSGNCHSLPIFYKILCEEIGAKASLALAPNHLYIKHIDENGQWTNVELTNGGFPRDQWIIKEMAITVEAIRSGIYMSPLTPKQSISLTMLDLVNAYTSRHGYDEFILTVINTALNYFPKCIPLLMTKANFYKAALEKNQVQIKPDDKLINAYHSRYKKTIAKIDSLGHKDMPQTLYEEWVNSVEKEKNKRSPGKQTTAND